MKFVLASWGSRGDLEPCVALGYELQHRGHDVRIAVPPDQVGFAESAGLAAMAFGPDARPILDAHRVFWTLLFRKPWRIRELLRLRRAVAEPVIQRWEEICASLAALADGADLLISGVNFEQPAANVAEYHGIPLATLHISPHRANGQVMSFLPTRLGRSAMTVFESMAWRAGKKLEDTQRQALGLPKATQPVPRRIAERGWLELQAYDEVCFSGLAEEWAKLDGQRAFNRQFVGALTMESATGADEDVASWIAAGTPPIFFGFGSIAVDSPADTIAMIGEACAQLGERALVGAGWSDYRDVPHFDHVKVVGAVNYAEIFPACRAVVHHGGVGTTGASLRAGVATLVLWTDLEHRLWGARVKRLKVGTARRFSATTKKSLVADLRTILDPNYATRAREVARKMTMAVESAAAAADLVEKSARVG